MHTLLGMIISFLKLIDQSLIELILISIIYLILHFISNYWMYYSKRDLSLAWLNILLWVRGVIVPLVYPMAAPIVSLIVSLTALRSPLITPTQCLKRYRFVSIVRTRSFMIICKSMIFSISISIVVISFL